MVPFRESVHHFLTTSFWMKYETAGILTPDKYTIIAEQMQCIYDTRRSEEHSVVAIYTETIYTGYT